MKQTIFLAAGLFALTACATPPAGDETADSATASAEESAPKKKAKKKDCETEQQTWSNLRRSEC